MNNFSIIEVLKQSYVYMFENFIKIISNMWLVLIFLWISSYFYVLQDPAENFAVAGPIQILVAGCNYLITIIVTAMLGVYILKNMFKEDNKAPGIGGVYWNNVTTNVFLAYFIEMIFMMVFLLPATLLMYKAPFFGLALLIIGLYISCRSCIIVPVCYLDGKIFESTIFKAWKLTKGQAFKIFVLSMGMILPIYLVFCGPIFIIDKLKLLSFSAYLLPIMYAIAAVISTIIMFIVKIFLYQHLTKPVKGEINEQV